MPKLELVSFKLCPFAQRALITLLHKGAEFQVTYIDLTNPPAWFTEISPLGKVPLLKVTDDNDKEHIVFESSVICGYLDEITPGTMFPADPLERAKIKAWVDFASACMEDLFKLVTSVEQTASQDAQGGLTHKLEYLEHHLVIPDEFSMLDAAFAPLFVRLDIIKEMAAVIDSDKLPKVTAWSNKLLETTEVKNSSVAELPQMYTGMIKSRGSYIGNM